MEKQKLGVESFYVGPLQERRGHVCKVLSHRVLGESGYGLVSFPELGTCEDMPLEWCHVVPVAGAGRKRLTLAVDFDDTIVHTDFPAIRGLRDGAREYINQLHDDGHYIIIWTCRCGDHQHEAEKFLYENGIRYHAINRHNPKSILLYKNDTRKIGADVYIDDKNLLGLPPWEEVYRIVNTKAILEYEEAGIQKTYTRQMWIEEDDFKDILKEAYGEVAAVK